MNNYRLVCIQPTRIGRWYNMIRGAKIQKFGQRGGSGQPHNFDDRSGNKQQLIDLPLFDTNEDQEILGGWPGGRWVGFITDCLWNCSPSPTAQQFWTENCLICQQMKSGWSLLQRLVSPVGQISPHSSCGRHLLHSSSSSSLGLLDLSRTVCGRGGSLGLIAPQSAQLLVLTL